LKSRVFHAAHEGVKNLFGRWESAIGFWGCVLALEMLVWQSPARVGSEAGKFGLAKLALDGRF